MHCWQGVPNSYNNAYDKIQQKCPKAELHQNANRLPDIPQYEDHHTILSIISITIHKLLYAKPLIDCQTLTSSISKTSVGFIHYLTTTTCFSRRDFIFQNYQHETLSSNDYVFSPNYVKSSKSRHKHK